MTTTMAVMNFTLDMDELDRQLISIRRQPPDTEEAEFEMVGWFLWRLDGTIGPLATPQPRR